MTKAYVYFIKESLGELAPIKIGVATDVEKRLKVLQTGNSRRLECLAILGPFHQERAFKVEASLHRKFKKFKIRGEWFLGSIIGKMHTLREYDQISRS